MFTFLWVLFSTVAEESQVQNHPRLYSKGILYLKRGFWSNLGIQHNAQQNSNIILHKFWKNNFQVHMETQKNQSSWEIEFWIIEDLQEVLPSLTSSCTTEL